MKTNPKIALNVYTGLKYSEFYSYSCLAYPHDVWQYSDVKLTIINKSISYHNPTKYNLNKVTFI